MDFQHRFVLRNAPSGVSQCNSLACPLVAVDCLPEAQSVVGAELCIPGGTLLSPSHASLKSLVAVVRSAATEMVRTPDAPVRWELFLEVLCLQASGQVRRQ